MDEFQKLHFFLHQFVDIPDEEWSQYKSFLTIHRFKKGEYLFRAGESYTQIGFMTSGLAYSFVETENGKEYVKYFNWPGKLISPLSDILNSQPATCSALFLEDSEVISVHYSDLVQFYKRHICWERMGRIMLEQVYLIKDRREMELLILDAKRRYQAFLEVHSPIADRIPQYLVAAYLGITPVALSRVINLK